MKMTEYELFDTYPELKKLDDYSKSVAREIYADYPQWFPFASCNGHHLVIAFQSPHESNSRQLIISTNNNEITISFVPYYHSHFNCWECGEYREYSYMLDAKGFSEALLEESIVIYWKVENEAHIYGGSTLRAELDDLEVDWTYVVSWLGTFDRTAR